MVSGSPQSRADLCANGGLRQGDRGVPDRGRVGHTAGAVVVKLVENLLSAEEVLRRRNSRAPGAGDRSRERRRKVFSGTKPGGRRKGYARSGRVAAEEKRAICSGAPGAGERVFETARSE